jgi:hypothetical protein
MWRKIGMAEKEVANDMVVPRRQCLTSVSISLSGGLYYAEETLYDVKGYEVQGS